MSFFISTYFEIRVQGYWCLMCNLIRKWVKAEKGQREVMGLKLRGNSQGKRREYL